MSWSGKCPWDRCCGWCGSHLRLETTIKDLMQWKLFYKVNLMWNVPITMSEVHLLIQDIPILFCWFSLILFLECLRILLPAVVISMFSLATQRWNSGTYNSRISRLATAGKHINYQLLDANNIYSAYFGCLALQLRNISTSDEQSCSQSVPPGPASEPGREVMCLGISHSGSTYHLNKRIPSIFWQMATLWNSCREAKGPTFKAHVQHKKLTATYSYGSAVLK